MSLLIRISEGSDLLWVVSCAAVFASTQNCTNKVMWIAKISQRTYFECRKQKSISLTNSRTKPQNHWRLLLTCTGICFRLLLGLTTHLFPQESKTKYLSHVPAGKILFAKGSVMVEVGDRLHGSCFMNGPLPPQKIRTCDQLPGNGMSSARKPIPKKESNLIHPEAKRISNSFRQSIVTKTLWSSHGEK